MGHIICCLPTTDIGMDEHILTKVGHPHFNEILGHVASLHTDRVFIGG